MTTGRNPAESRLVDPIKGAVAGAIAGAAGAYTMERFQEWWNDMEKRAAPTQRAHAVKDGATDKATDEPATVKVAELVSKKVLDAELPDEMKPAAGEAVHYATGATIGAIYGFVAEILPPARMFNGLLMGSIVWWTADNMAVPATKLGKKPEQVPPSKHAYALSSHLVYGFTTELVRSLVRLVI
jgi:putative membrane protein